MRRIVQTTPGGVFVAPWIPLDWDHCPFEVGVACVVTGTVAYTLEYTYDDIFNPAITPTAWPTTILAATANKDLQLTGPVAAIRINQASGAGTVTMTVLQGLKG